MIILSREEGATCFCLFLGKHVQCDAMAHCRRRNGDGDGNGGIDDDDRAGCLALCGCFAIFGRAKGGHATGDPRQ